MTWSTVVLQFLSLLRKSRAHDRQQAWVGSEEEKQIESELLDAASQRDKSLSLGRVFAAHRKQLLGKFGDMQRDVSMQHLVACCNAVNVVRLLLSEVNSGGVDCNKPTTGGCLGYPIAFAAALGHADVVHTLMEMSTENNSLALIKAQHAAAALGHGVIVKDLLDFDRKLLKNR